MTPDQCWEAVQQSARVRLRTNDGGTYREGVVIAYSIVPTVTIITDTGERVCWRHDLTEPVSE